MASALLAPILVRAAGRDAAKKERITTCPARTLARPFVLPQQTYGPDSPFVRGYSPLLPVSEPAFVAFVDRLNAAMCRSPEAQALTVASFASMVVCVQRAALSWAEWNCS